MPLKVENLEPDVPDWFFKRFLDERDPYYGTLTLTFDQSSARSWQKRLQRPKILSKPTGQQLPFKLQSPLAGRESLQSSTTLPYRNPLQRGASSKTGSGSLGRKRRPIVLHN